MENRKVNLARNGNSWTWEIKTGSKVNFWFRLDEYHSLNEDLFREKIKVSDVDISISCFVDHVQIKNREYKIHVKCLD